MSNAVSNAIRDIAPTEYSYTCIYIYCYTDVDTDTNVDTDTGVHVYVLPRVPIYYWLPPRASAVWTGGVTCYAKAEQHDSA